MACASEPVVRLTAGPDTGRPHPIGGMTLGDAARIGCRISALLLLLAVCIAGHYLSIAVAGRSAWPRRFLGTAARIVGADVRIAGARAPAPVLLIANHLSWLDILVLAGATGTAFVGHDGLLRQTLLRWLCRMNRTVFIARDRGSVADQTALVRGALTRGSVLTLFPEGTTGDGLRMARFKSSLLAAVDPRSGLLSSPGLSLQPVLIDYGRAAPQIAWTDAEPGVRNFMRILARSRRLGVTLRFLTPLAGDELADRKAMARAAEARIRAAQSATPGAVTV